jgi:hypothetical protein
VAEIHSKIELLDRRISAAHTLFELLNQVTDSVSVGDQLSAVVVPKAPSRPLRGEFTYKEAVREVVYAHDRIAPYTVKEMLLRGPLGERLTESDKGFYHAISRLAEAGEIVRHNGWLLSPENYKLHMERVRAREIEDDKPLPPTRSPMGEAILEYVNGHPGAASKDVIASLKKNTDFAAALEPNSTLAYNIIARLAKRKQIIKTGGKLYPLDHEANEPSSGEPADGSDASEGREPLADFLSTRRTVALTEEGQRDLANHP